MKSQCCTVYAIVIAFVYYGKNNKSFYYSNLTSVNSKRILLNCIFKECNVL